MSLLRGLASAVACAATPDVSPHAIQPLDLEGRAMSGGSDDEVMVFLLAGQSNMVGRGNGTALSKSLLRRLHSLSDPKKGDCPIGYYAAGLAGAGSTSYNDSVCSMGIEHRYPVFDLRSSAFQPIERMRLAPVEGCVWEKTIFRLDTHFGPEISLGLALNEQWPTRRIVLSKRALSGSTLATGWTPGTDGYRALLADFRLIAADHYPRRVVLSGFLWLQGEADAKDARDAKNYKSNLLSLVWSRACGTTRAPLRCQSSSSASQAACRVSRAPRARFRRRWTAPLSRSRTVWRECRTWPTPPPQLRPLTRAPTTTWPSAARAAWRA